jgi:uncharacterized protein (DUF4415 family)
MSVKKKGTRKPWADPDDAPEITREFFKRADLYEGNRLVRRGRPKADVTKERISIRLSPDVLARFRKSGAGWQTRIDAALRDWLKRNAPR